MEAGPKRGDRLEFKNGKLLDVMLRQLMLDAANLIQQDQNGKLYLFGMHGTGKSHTLYGAALYWLREDLQKRRLFYISDCGVWGDTMCKETAAPAYEYLLQAIARCFCNDITIVSEVQQCPLEETSVKALLHKILCDMCPKSQLDVWIIFDQHNRISVEVRKQYPFSLIERDLLNFMEFFTNGGKLIISASSNNEYRDIATLTPMFSPLMQPSFNKDELKAWKTRFAVPEIPAGKLLELTWHVPYQLTVFRKELERVENANVNMAVSHFQSQVRDSIQQQHLKWKKQLDEDQKKSLANTVFLLAAEKIDISSMKASLFLDKRFMMEVYDNTISLRGLTPYIQDVYVNMYRGGMGDNLEIAAQTLLANPSIDGGTKGRLAEFLVISSFVKNHHVVLPMSPKSTKTPNRSSFSHTVRWLGNEVPTFEECDEKLDCNTLFWPHSQNYPDVDCLFYRANKRLYAIQITIAARHDQSFDDKIDQWTRLFTGNVKNVGTISLEFVWIGLDEDLKKSTNLTSTNKKVSQTFLSLREFEFLPEALFS